MPFRYKLPTLAELSEKIEELSDDEERGNKFVELGKPDLRWLEEKSALFFFKPEDFTRAVRESEQKVWLPYSQLRHRDRNTIFASEWILDERGIRV